MRMEAWQGETSTRTHGPAFGSLESLGWLETRTPNFGSGAWICTVYVRDRHISGMFARRFSWEPGTTGVGLTASASLTLELPSACLSDVKIV